MPTLDEILSYLDQPVDPEKDAGFLAEINARKSQGNASVRRQVNASRTMDKRAEQLGIEAFPDPKPSLLSRIFDTLDTPRQFVAGDIAKLTGREGYSDLGFLDAGAKGTQENLTTGEMLEDTDYFKDKPIRRGIAGFVGDVLTDPLSFISPFGSAVKKGGLSLSKEAIQTVHGLETGAEIANRLAETNKARLISEATAKYGDVLPEGLQGTLEARGSLEAGEPFNAYNLLREKRKDVLRAGSVSGEVDATLHADLAKKAVGLADDLGVEFTIGKTGAETATGIFDTLDTLVRKPSIRISGPLAGAGTLGKLPLFGSRDVDIPGVTAASELAYQALADGYYGTVATVKKGIQKGLENDPESILWNLADKVGDTLLKANKGAVKFASLLSRRVQASGKLFGSAASANAVSELARSRGLLQLQATQETEALFGGLAKQPGSDEMFKKMTSVLQAYPDIEKGGVQKITELYGPEAGEALRRARFVFDDLAAKETEAGILGKTLEGYVYQMHTPKAGMDDAGSHAWSEIQGYFGPPGSTPDFSLQRTFANISKAKAAGYAPDENLFNIVAARTAHSKQAFAEKDFFERLAYQNSMSPAAYQKLLAATMSESATIRRNAQNAISSLDLALDPDAAFKAQYPDAKFASPGKLMTTTNYDELRQTHNEFEAAPESFLDPERQQRLAAMLEKKTELGLDFSDAERMKIEALEKVNAQSLAMIPGRHGESAIARAGANTLNGAMRRELKNLSPEETEFWNSALPNGFVDTVDESLHGKNLLQSLAQGLRSKTGPHAELRSPILKMVSGYQDWTRFLKKTATLPWPAYWARNLTSAFFQPLQSVAALGESLNPLRIYRNSRILQDDARVILSETGEKLTGRQLKAEMIAANMTTSGTMASEFMNAYADQLGRMSEAVKYNVPGLRATAERELVKKEGNILKRGAQKYTDFGQAMEAWGRQHSYMHLRFAGHDATSAQALANKYMVDYAHGKTEFEKNILNNVFFFYAFSRGNASNMFMQMAMRPGALTTQLHAFDGIAEMLTDPANYNHDPDYEELIRTTRTDTELSKYVGTNPITGLPRVLQSIGMPAEDLGKYLAAADTFTKPKHLTWSELLHASGDATQKTFENVFAQVNPVARTMVEVLAKKDFYFDRPLNDETLRKFPSWERDMPKVLHALTPAWALPDKTWELLDDVTKGVLDGRKNKDGTITINPYAMTVISKLLGAGRAINTRKFLTDPGVSNAEKLGRFASGLNVQEVDPEKTLAYTGAKDREEYYQARDLPRTKRQFLRAKAAQDE